MHITHYWSDLSEKYKAHPFDFTMLLNLDNSSHCVQFNISTINQVPKEKKSQIGPCLNLFSSHMF